MDEVMTASNAIWNESVQAQTLAIAAEMGAGPDKLLELYGIDFTAELADARAAVDADQVLQNEPTLRQSLAALHAERPAIDDGTLASDSGARTFAAMTDAVDALWRATRGHLEDTIAHGSVDGPVLRGAEALRASYDAFLAGGDRIAFARKLADASPGASVRDLIESNTHVVAATDGLEAHLGTAGAAAYRVFRGDPAVARFDRVVDMLIADGLAGRPSPLATDGVAFGAAFVDSAAWIDSSMRVVAAASGDLSILAATEAKAQAGGFWSLVTTAALAFALSMIAVALLSRAVTRPLDRIATVVQAVRDGAFDIPQVLLHGPRELYDTVGAVNDMAASIDESSHDGITGLLNRRAALDAVGRDLARARRDGDRVIAIFLDLDRLKVINDVYGHQAGDRALALVGDALRQTCRDADVLARLGGDEFLVAGIVRNDVDAGADMAERICQAVERSVLWCDDTPITLRCSIGVSMNEPGSIDVDALLADADAAMYRMKIAGRDA